MFTTEELQLMADALAAHYTRWQDEDMRKLLDKIIRERERQRINTLCTLVYEGPNYNTKTRFVPIKPSDITYGGITTEAMNRILRTIGNKEMG